MRSNNPYYINQCRENMKVDLNDINNEMEDPRSFIYLIKLLNNDSKVIHNKQKNF